MSENDDLQVIKNKLKTNLDIIQAEYDRVVAQRDALQRVIDNTLCDIDSYRWGLPVTSPMYAAALHCKILLHVNFANRK